MNTLTIDPVVLEKAQHYATETGMNLSTYMENHLKALYIQDEEWQERMEDTNIDALLDSLTGILPEMTDEEVREECANYIENKYFTLG